MATVELCSFIWSDLLNQTHVCDQPDGHEGSHYCHCGLVYCTGDDAQDTK